MTHWDARMEELHLLRDSCISRLLERGIRWLAVYSLDLRERMVLYRQVKKSCGRSFHTWYPHGRTLVEAA